jgi:hypothetical protein
MAQQVWSVPLAPAKETGLLPSPRLSTGREGFPASGSRMEERPWLRLWRILRGTRF